MTSWPHHTHQLQIKWVCSVAALQCYYLDSSEHVDVDIMYSVHQAPFNDKIQSMELQHLTITNSYSAGLRGVTKQYWLTEIPLVESYKMIW